MNKIYIFPVILFLVIGVFIGTDKLGFFDWFAETEYGWVITDQANPYIDKSIYHEAPAEHKVKWWMSVMGDPERRYHAIHYTDSVYHWDKIENIYKAHEMGGLNKDELYNVLLVAAKEGTFDNRNNNTKGIDSASVNRELYAKGDESGYVIMGDKVVTLTKLNEYGMEIQELRGCVACHEEK